MGEGELTSHEGVYKGSFRHGLPHGMGFWRYKGGEMYEGELVDNNRQGQGILLMQDRTEYKGEWKDDKLNGWGEVSFAEGGSYRGQWKDSQFHGHGTIVYAGSGNTYEGEFAAGRIAGTPPPVVERGAFPILPDRFRQYQPIFARLPPDASWEMLTESQKQTVRESYPALEPGDEPPYPLKGTRESLAAVVKINQLANAVEGDLRIDVLIGADGQAKLAKVYEKPKPGDSGAKIDTMVHYVSVVMMLDKYKPAKCRGTPCEMIYPILYHFTVD